jgi:hypothetical protein
MDRQTGAKIGCMASAPRGRRKSIGIVLLVVAALGMLWWARRKRNLATQPSSASLKADTAESSLREYLSWIALAGIVANAVWDLAGRPHGRTDASSFVPEEGWQAIQASRRGCDCRSVEPTKGDAAVNR